MRLGVELSFDLVAWAPRSNRGIIGFAQRIATLNHESFDNAVERGAVVKALRRELLKIFDRFGSYVRPEPDRHLTFGG
jgi:hypothetical protein